MKSQLLILLGFLCICGVILLCSRFSLPLTFKGLKQRSLCLFYLDMQISFIKFGKISTMISSLFSFCFITCMLVCLMTPHMSLMLFFFILFSLYSSNWIRSIDLSSLLIISSTRSDLLLNFSFQLLFNSRISVWIFFYIIYIFLLYLTLTIFFG